MPRSVHKLNPSDIQSNDKMNYTSITKLLNPAIEKWMLENIPASGATVAYLKMMRFVNAAFIDPVLSPTERVYKMAFVVFCLRIWKAHCKENKTRFLITSNIYTCIELNFHELIKLIIYFKEHDMDQYFLPTLFGSQDCEEFFRKLRSLTTLCSTIVNFSMLDLLYRIHRVDFLHYAESILAKYGVTPKQSSKGCTLFDMPSKEDIESVVLNALIDAEEEMRILGIIAIHPILAHLSPLIVTSETSSETANEEAEPGIDYCNDYLELETNTTANTTEQENLSPSSDIASEIRLLLGNNNNNIEISHLVKNYSEYKSNRL